MQEAFDNPLPPGVDAGQALREANDMTRGTLMERLGIEWTEVGVRRIRARMPVGGNTQPYGLLHGGATAALCESIASFGTTVVAGLDKTVVGLELNINHLRAVRDGHVTATGVPLHVGRTTAVWDMRVDDDDGRLVAVSRLTLAIREGPPGSPAGGPGGSSPASEASGSGCFAPPAEADRRRRSADESETG